MLFFLLAQQGFLFKEAAKPVGEGGLGLRPLEVRVLKKLSSGRPYEYFPGDNFAVLTTLVKERRDSLALSYLRYALGLSRSRRDREAYIKAITLASRGDSLLYHYLKEGCNLSKPYSLDSSWRATADRALDSLLAYTLRRSKALKKGYYLGPTLEGETYAFRGILDRSEVVAWGSPPIMAVELKEAFPNMMTFLLSLGSIAFTMPSLALAYGRLEGSGEGARFVIKHLRAGRFASLTEYDVAPYEPCLPESLYYIVAKHPKVLGLMVAHTTSPRFPPIPYTLDTAFLDSVRRRTGKILLPDWFNMNALHMLSLYKAHWGKGGREVLHNLSPYPVLPGMEGPSPQGLFTTIVDEGEDLWNSPTLLSLYFLLKVVEQLYPISIEGPVETLPYLLREREDFWYYVYEIEEKVGWENIYLYTYHKVVELLRAASQ